MAETVDKEQFRALAAQSGLALSEAQLAELHEMHGYLVPMIERVCRARPREAEPALIFIAAQPS